MKGPPPKDPEQRRRRNKSTTSAILDLDDAARAKTPALPRALFASGRPHGNVRRWWRAIWRSPMAPRWLESDIEGLYLVATLRDLFARAPTTTLAAEIRQQESRFGLDTFARKKLDWRIGGAPAASTKASPFTPPKAPEGDDPRLGLRAIK